ncbi:3',5'-cyclic-nucleotide phosphodiesterase [Alteromonas sp. 14N.309.X.WAT.G.H12]|uniref:3',5'-cyclic-nucleotide phosphodiesterase n=1 Tax=Alteromonas sp. 14N.309.X.WAT.G.H12 TaxID=3120824 RepID=UPI002FD2073E
MRILFCIFSLFSLHSYGQDGFDVVALGVNGGINDGNLTAFFISPKGDARGVMCDAGTLVKGVDVALHRGGFDPILSPTAKDSATVGTVIKSHIKGYLISHAHLDHVAGLIIASPDDVKKNIYAFPEVINDISETYFNWRAWPNFGNTGTTPALGKYTYVALEQGETALIAHTQMQVTPFPLSHSGIKSTAFLIEHNDSALLCMGDTGADSIEKTDKLARLWQALAHHLKDKTLTGIIIESSYTNARPDKLLFGHLTPRLVKQSLRQFIQISEDAQALQGVKVVISHIKYSLESGQSNKKVIEEELNSNNTLGAEFILPSQGDYISFE